MVRMALTAVVATALAVPSAAAFSPPPTFATHRQAAAGPSVTTMSLEAIPDPAAAAAAIHSASVHLSTVDSDIASISNDQFQTVFAGGLVVMAGGLVSALAVGAILDAGDNYANVIADSYAQGGDEEFWESLTPEQREETEWLMQKVKESKNKGEEVEGGESEVVVAASAEAEIVVKESPTKKGGEGKEELSMFSDYD